MMCRLIPQSSICFNRPAVRGRDMYVYENKRKKTDVKTWHRLDVVRKVGTVETQTHYSDTCTCTCRVYMVQELGEPYLLPTCT